MLGDRTTHPIPLAPLQNTLNNLGKEGSIITRKIGLEEPCKISYSSQ
jgi:hypothetical protein